MKNERMFLVGTVNVFCLEHIILAHTDTLVYSFRVFTIRCYIIIIISDRGHFSGLQRYAIV